MPPSTQPHRLTYDDFLLFPDDGKRHELIDGEHFVTPSPNMRHQDLLGRLHTAIAIHLSTRRHLGRVFLSPFDVIFTKTDLLFSAGDQLDILTKQVQGAPALVVEILSPGTRQKDEQLKRRLFERAGVREYWIVDPDRNSIRVFRRDEGGQLPLVAEPTHAGDSLTTPLLPDFVLPLDTFFSED
jgi:Uma2 family endonuclease